MSPHLHSQAGRFMGIQRNRWRKYLEPKEVWLLEPLSTNNIQYYNCRYLQVFRNSYISWHFWTFWFPCPLLLNINRTIVETSLNKGLFQLGQCLGPDTADKLWPSITRFSEPKKNNTPSLQVPQMSSVQNPVVPFDPGWLTQVPAHGLW